MILRRKCMDRKTKAQPLLGDTIMFIDPENELKWRPKLESALLALTGG